MNQRDFLPVRRSGLSGYVSDATRGNVQLTQDEARELQYQKEMEDKSKPKEETRRTKRVKFWEHAGVDLAEFVAGLTLSEMLLNPGALTSAMYYIGSGALPDAWFASNAETVENMYNAANIILKTNRLRGVEGLEEEEQVRELAKARATMLARRDAARNYLNLQDVEFTRPFQRADAAMGGNYSRLMGRKGLDDPEFNRLYSNRMSEFEKAREAYLRNRGVGRVSGDRWYTRGLRYASGRANEISEGVDNAMSGLRTNAENIRSALEDVRTGVSNISNARVPSFSSQVPAFSGVNLPRGLTSYALRDDYGLPSLRGAAVNVRDAASKLSLPLRGSDLKDVEMVGYPSRYKEEEKRAASVIQNRFRSNRLKDAYNDLRLEYRKRKYNRLSDLERAGTKVQKAFRKRPSSVEKEASGNLEGYSDALDRALGVDKKKTLKGGSRRQYNSKGRADRKSGIKRHSDWRDRIAGEEFRSSKATKLQSAYRGGVARREYNKKRKAAIGVQSLYRRNKARTSYLDALRENRESSYPGSGWVRRAPRRSAGIQNLAWNYERRSWDPRRSRSSFPSPPYGYGGM